MRFGTTASEVIALDDGARTSYDHGTGGQPICYRLVAYDGANRLGGTEVICVVPGAWRFVTGASTTIGLEQLRIPLELVPGEGR